MDRQTIPNPPGAPERIKGMVPGVRANGFIFLSAVRGRDPETNTLSDDPATQARQAFENLKVILDGAGSSLRHVVHVMLYLTDLKYRKDFHDVWLEYFPADPPARTAVQVADASPAPGGNAHFALDVIALAG
ncbi:RidA family protein [Dactylosporangium sp. CA-092794]|uniref:RidA family protein n=1 Tax=Dactylosporangium sp. CA-092794 TaxID=3239929 RepID=UPI003D904B83